MINWNKFTKFQFLVKLTLFFTLIKKVLHIYIIYLTFSPNMNTIIFYFL